MQRAVKYGAIGFGLVVAGSFTQSAARGAYGPLFGGTVPTAKPPAPLDAALPLGPQVPAPMSRPDSAEPPACSFRYPVCVHRGQASPDEALGWLEALEGSYRNLVLALGAPSPLPDLGGGTAGLDLYLVGDDQPLSVTPTGPLAFDHDESAAFCRVGAGVRLRERAASHCIGEAIAWRLDAAEGGHAKRALAEHLWLSTGASSSADARAIDTVQRHPERTLFARDLSEWSEGSALSFELLDARHGVGRPGAIGLSLFALGSAEPSPIGWRFSNEPDLVDVLRENFGKKPSDWGRFLGDLAVARAQIGNRSALPQLDELAWTGSFGRVRFEWVLPLSSLPRRVAPLSPIEPMGMSYVWIALDEPTDGLTLAVSADWEAPVAFKWVLVTVGADGREIRRVDMPYLERATHVERSLVDFEGAVGVLIAGVNGGDLSPTYPFDPDFSPYEPHGYTLYVAKL